MVPASPCTLVSVPVLPRTTPRPARLWSSPNFVARLPSTPATGRPVSSGPQLGVARPGRRPAGAWSGSRPGSACCGTARCRRRAGCPTVQTPRSLSRAATTAAPSVNEPLRFAATRRLAQQHLGAVVVAGHEDVLDDPLERHRRDGGDPGRALGRPAGCRPSRRRRCPASPAAWRTPAPRPSPGRPPAGRARRRRASCGPRSPRAAETREATSPYVPGQVGFQAGPENRDAS